MVLILLARQHVSQMLTRLLQDLGPDLVSTQVLVEIVIMLD